MTKKSKVFGRRRYYLWNSSWRRGDLVREAKTLRRNGLLARVVTVPDKFAPKGASYELYVYGSVRDTVRG